MAQLTNKRDMISVDNPMNDDVVAELSFPGEGEAEKFVSTKAAAPAPTTKAEVPLVLKASVREYNVKAWCKACWFTPDGVYFAIGGDNKMLLLFTVATGNLVLTVHRSVSVRASAISADGKMFCVCDGSGLLTVHLTATELGYIDYIDPDDVDEPQDSSEADIVWQHTHGKALNSAQFIHDGAFLAVTDVAGRVHIHDSATGVVKSPTTPMDVGAGNVASGSLTCSRSWPGAASEGGSLLATSAVGGFKAKVWNVPEFSEVQTMAFTFPVWAVALKPNGTRLALSAADGVLRIYNTAKYDAHGQWELSVRLTVSSPPQGLLYDSTGQMLATTCPTMGSCHVYNEDCSMAEVARFDCGGVGAARVLAFGPGDALLATAGGHSKKVVFRTLKPNGGFLNEFVIGSKEEKLVGQMGMSVSACDKYIGIGSKYYYQVMKYDGTEVARLGQLEVPDDSDDFGSASSDFHPDGNQVVYGKWLGRTATVHALPSGDVVNTFGRFSGALNGARWSPEGDMLCAWGAFGAQIFNSTAPFELLYSFEDKVHLTEEMGTWVNDCKVSPKSNKVIATCGASNIVFLRNVETGTQEEDYITHQFLESGPTEGLCFNHTGSRIAYGIPSLRQVILRDIERGTIVHRFDSMLGAARPREFRCGNLIACYIKGDGNMEDEVVVLDTDTGMPTDWSAYLAPFALRGVGHVSRNAVGWATSPVLTVDDPDTNDAMAIAESPLAGPEDTDSGKKTDNTPLWMYAAVGNKVTVVDVRRFILEFEGDGTFDTAQLDELTERRPHLVQGLVAKHKFCVNLRGAVGGNTVLHKCCVGGRYTDSMKAWLSHGFYCPIENENLETALHAAVRNNSKPALHTLTEKLTRTPNPAVAALLTKSLCLIAREMPDQVLWFLQTVEPILVAQQGGVLTAWVHRTEATGSSMFFGEPDNLWMPLLSDEEPSVVAAMGAAAGDLVKGMGAAAGGLLLGAVGMDPHTTEAQVKRHRDARPMKVASKILAMRNFIGAPQTPDGEDASPFHVIVANCDAGVFESKLMTLAVQFKWERNVFPQLYKDATKYVTTLLLVSWSMVMASHQISTLLLRHCFVGMTFVLVGVRLVSESYEAINQTPQVYFASLWNVVDVVGILSLVIACLCHTFASVMLADVEDEYGTVVPWNQSLTFSAVQYSAATGVFAMWFGLLQLLRCFENYGPLIRTIIVIVQDIVPFMAIMTIIITASALFFMISMPEKESFNGIDGSMSSDSPAGPAQAMLTVFFATLGSFSKSDYDKPAAIVIFVFFALFVIIVLLNLLIAIMGDSFSKVKDSEIVEGRRERAAMIVESELNDGEHHDFPKYMHILESVDVDDSGFAWEGLGGKLRSEVRKLKTDLDGCEMRLQNHVDKGFEDIHQQITMLTKLMQNIATTQAAEHHASKYHVVKNQ